MWKKLLVVAVVLAAGFAAVKVGVHREAFRVWKTETAPTVEQQLDDARKEVAKLDRDMEKVRTELAKEIVAVRNLTNDTANMRTDIETQKNTLVKQGEDIKDATERVKYGSAMLSIPEATARLQKDAKIHQTKKRTLDSMEKTLASRESIRETLHKQLDGLTKQKSELLAEIDSIEADYKAVQLQQIENRHQFDNSRLAKIKEQLRTIRNDVDVEKVRLELTPGQPKDEVKASAETTQTVDEILAQVGGKK